MTALAEPALEQVGGDEADDDLEVLIPVAGYPLAKLVAPSSAIVGSRTSRMGGDENGRMTVYYEGNLYGAGNIVTYGDRAYHAADRLRTGYPTVAMASVLKEEVIAVGWYRPSGPGRVVVHPYSQRDVHRIAEWLDIPATEVNQQLRRSI